MTAKFLTTLLVLLFFSPPLLTAREVGDAEIPETLEKANYSFVLNGAGIRSKFFMDIYVSALYLQEKSQDAEKILRDNSPMALRLHIVSGLVDSEKLKDAINDGFEASTGGNIAPVESQINEFMALMESEETVKGDYYDFVYVPEEGMKIYKNDSYKKDIKGLSFKRAFFGIWLGNDPADDDLKEEMLGL